MCDLKMVCGFEEEISQATESLGVTEKVLWQAAVQSFLRLSREVQLERLAEYFRILSEREAL